MRDNEIDVLGTFIHGCLASLHCVGIVYNLRRKNYADTTIHTLVFCYDLYATYRHYKNVKEIK